ncbi:MAG: PLP-dependent aminotransferase family protein [Alphaproteobacteria bacterium]|nr:PLP-dependent aminotransferase family protein [Alphaproteobacteria bacterium]
MAALISLEGTGPLKRRLALGLKAAIHAGRLQPGARAPSSRELAGALGVSRNVVLAAYEELTAEGYFRGRTGAGTFVSAAPPTLRAERARRSVSRSNEGKGAVEAPTLSAFGKRAGELAPHRDFQDAGPRSRIDFQYWQVAPDPEAVREWGRLARARLRSPRFAYAEAAGASELRKAIATHIAAARAIDVHEDDVMIVSGAQQALDLVARTVLDAGDRVLLEEPHYQGARQSFLAAGARLTAAPVDEAGLNLSKVPARECKLVYATPSHQFPTGAAMPFGRRLETLQWCRSAGAWLLEDDYDSEYQHDGKRLAALRALDPERVIYVATFARAFAPSLRLGFVIAPAALREALTASKWLADRGSAAFEQLVLADFIEAGCYDRHLRRMGKIYGEKRERLVAAIEREFGDEADVTGASAGIHVFVWLNMRRPNDGPEIVSEGRALGVGVYSGCRYFSAMPPRGGFLLGYATTPMNRIDDGIARFAHAWRAYSKGKPLRT